MIVRVQPSAIKGEIVAPASKSSMQRACAAALVRKGTSIISNPGISNDDKAALSIIENLGAKWEMANDKLIVKSEGVKPISNEVNCGESGLSIRMFSPIVALSEKEITVNGKGSLATRPMDFFDEVLPQVGVKINSNGGKLPLKIQGPLQAKDISIDGSLSSQFLTGLLMAYAASNANDVSITVDNLKSKPYIDLTLKVMSDFGLNVPENRNHESFYFSGKPTDANETINYTVEGDWSGGAFLLVAGAIAGDIVVKGLDVFSTQADKAILEALMSCGAKISIEKKQITIGPAQLKAFHFNATDCPDLFPPLVALASYCEGKTVIEGVSRLAHKESNRGLTLQQEFGKMGVEIELQDDLMIVNGSGIIKGATTHSHHDHRIAMACAVAGLKAESEMIIEEAEAISKSYPNFYEHLKQLGASVSSLDKQLN
ncbi:3-phosphoshikimate 1-carboxyvinyltransferase [Ferruginibacter albus]|uniref:3-phosphoshikimate 1-carboxyvinyltransferase n=1 Tax=Ferruginibacter albus TaxID=2875540 RepID=UPI001CC51D46|nr:3-phosphoshikimate 1-carboxyvinyltransferase [Ferruginibacter albus]UAY53509.1 3-phosphoshikimate 1-carboxyvinyltransferase [Ferruginibacter albus]